MREILFRGKRIDDYVNDKSIDYAEKGFREWVYGDIIHRRYYKNKDVVVIRTEDSGFDNYSDYEVDPSTVGQYTGLTDKNGKKIFEGDILKEDDVLHNGETQIKGRIGTCSFEKGCWVILFKDTWVFLQTNIKACSVVGNIHDNPRLLDQIE